MHGVHKTDLQVTVIPKIIKYRLMALIVNI